MKTINVTPYHCDVVNDHAGFSLVFWCNTPGDAKVKVKLKFEFWWLTFLARHLWEAIAHRQKKLDEASNAMTRKP